MSVENAVRRVLIRDSKVNEFNSTREIIDEADGEILCVEYFGDVKGMLKQQKYSASTMLTIIKALDVTVERTPSGKGRYITISEVGAKIPLWSFWDGELVHRNSLITIDTATGEVIGQPTGRRKGKRGGKAEFVRIKQTKLMEMTAGMTMPECGMLMFFIPYIEYGTGRLVMKRKGRGNKHFPLTVAEIHRITGTSASTISSYFKVYKEHNIIEWRKDAYYVNTAWIWKGTVRDGTHKIQTNEVECSEELRGYAEAAVVHQCE